MDKQTDFHKFEKLFWQLSREMGYFWRQIYDETFPGSQSHILFSLQRHGPQKMSELADSLHLTPGAVTTASDKLIDHGFLARVRDENDRRIVHLQLTEKGTLKLNELQNKGRQTMKAVFKDMTDHDLERMNAIFIQATKNIEQIGKDYDK